MKTSYNIAVLPGDGIGVEVMAVCLKLLEHLQKQSNEFQLKLKQYPAGAAHYRDVGDALPQRLVGLLRADPLQQRFGQDVLVRHGGPISSW